MGSGSLLDSFAHIRAAFEQAPFQPDGWHAAIDLLGVSSGGWCGQLAGATPTGALPVNILTRMSVNDALAFEKAGGAIEGDNPRAAVLRRPVGDVVSDDLYISTEARRSSAIFQELYEPNEASDAVIANIGEHRGANFLLTMIYGGGQRGRIEEGRAMMQAVAPYAIAALRAQSALNEAVERGAVATLDAMAVAGILLDWSGRVVGMSRAGEAELAGAGLVTVSAGQLRPVDRRSTAELETAITCALLREGDLLAPRASTLLLRDAGGGVRRVDVSPIPIEARQFPRNGRALVILGPPPPLASPMEALRQGFGLTAAEAEVAIHLSRGASAREIAEMRGVSLATARDQVKAVLHRTDMHKASALAALLARLGL